MLKHSELLRAPGGVRASAYAAPQAVPGPPPERQHSSSVQPRSLGRTRARSGPSDRPTRAGAHVRSGARPAKRWPAERSMPSPKPSPVFWRVRRIVGDMGGWPLDVDASSMDAITAALPLRKPGISSAALPEERAPQPGAQAARRAHQRARRARAARCQRRGAFWQRWPMCVVALQCALLRMPPAQQFGRSSRPSEVAGPPDAGAVKMLAGTAGTKRRAAS